MEKTHAKFETTHWSLVGDLASDNAESRRTALARLTETYWPPIYGYLRRRGRQREEAAELTQAFFTDVVLWRNLFERVDPDLGRLRSLVLAALRRFLIDCARRERRTPTSGASRLDPLRLDHLEADIADAKGRSPESEFAREWAAAAVLEAQRRCEKHFRDRGKPAHWRVFEARVLRPAISTLDAPTLSALATELGFATPADAAAAVQVVKKRMLAILREIAAESAARPEDAEDEYQWILGALA